MATEKTSRKKTVDPLLSKLFQAEPRKGEVMKERIVRSAIKCIAAKGIEETSFEAIGKPLGIGRSHVAYHFKDKGDIIRTAMEFVIAQGQALTAERVAAAPGPRAQLRAIVEAFFQWASEDREAMAVYVLFLYYCTVHQDYRATHDAIRRTGAARLVGVMKQDAALRKGKSDEDLLDLAKSLQYLSFGALVTSSPRATSRPRPSPGPDVRFSLRQIRF